MDDQIDPVAVALNGAVARLHHILRRMAAHRGGPATLPDAQVELLRLVQRRPGISVKEAAEALRTAPNTVSTLVGDLAGAGLLERGRDPSNRRVVRLELTEGAHHRLDEYLRRRQVILAEALAMLDATALAALAAAVPNWCAWRIWWVSSPTSRPRPPTLRRLAHRSAWRIGIRDTLVGVLRWLTAGESHGPALVAILDGLPAGVEVTSADVGRELARRRLGYGRGARMAFEQDEVEFVGGLRHGLTLGSPVAIRVGNTEWPKWQLVMAVDPVDPQELAAQARNAPLTRPRPGHADLAGMQKYGYADARPILERASARETAARVAVGTVARAFIRQALGIEIVSHVIELGSVAAKPGLVPLPEDAARVDADPLRCLDPEASARMVAEVDAAKKDADTLGGIVEVLAYGVPPGLGSHVQWDRKLDARLATALMSIQAIKGVEIGDAFTQARSRGSQAHDEIVPTATGVRRVTDRAGGLEGGMTTGEPLRVRAAMKPISSLNRALSTVDVATGDPATAINQRSDVCAVPAAAVVAEAMVALVLAEAATEKFGGDSVAEIRRNLAGYLENLVIR